MDRVQLPAVGSAPVLDVVLDMMLDVVLDVMVLGVMVARIGDLGSPPNRVAALGLNLVLLVNPAGAAWVLTGRSTVHRLERWQTAYLPVFTAWVAIIVVGLPPVFAFR